MAATSDAFRPRGGGVLLAVLFIVAGLVFATPLVLFLDDPANVPDAQPVNEHAIEKHAESVDIYDRYTKGEYKCLRVYRNLAGNRLLWRFNYSDTSLEGGMITTVSGKAITAYLKPATYWGQVICRDGYSEIITVLGTCPAEMGCD